MMSDFTVASPATLPIASFGLCHRAPIDWEGSDHGCDLHRRAGEIPGAGDELPCPNRRVAEDALNCRPGPETNSLAILVAHTWGSAQEHTARACGREIERDRDAEFRVALNRRSASRSSMWPVPASRTSSRRSTPPRTARSTSIRMGIRTPLRTLSSMRSNTRRSISAKHISHGSSGGSDTAEGQAISGVDPFSWFIRRVDEAARGIGLRNAGYRYP